MADDARSSMHDLVYLFRRNRFAGIMNKQGVRSCCAYLYDTSLWGKLNRVSQQIPQHGSECFPVGCNECAFRLYIYRYAFEVCCAPQ